MKIVEIGAGVMPGPFFEGADQHIVSDISQDILDQAARQDPRFTPLLADATDLTEITSESTDIVLARNVFGDPSLGIDRQTFMSYVYDGMTRELTEKLHQKKLAIMHEASRILLKHGHLIIVEQYTPIEAREFIEKLSNAQLEMPLYLTLPEETELELVTPKNYAQFHLRYRPKTWVATKK